MLLIDDIVDTGITLSYLLAHIHEHGPRSLKVCALIDKPEARKIDVHPDWTAFSVHEPLADRFLVGLRPRLDGALPGPALHRHHSPARALGAAPGVS